MGFSVVRTAQLIGKISDSLKLETKKVSRALDDGCDTGQRRVALLSIDGYIVGVEILQGMPDQTPRDLHISYIRTPAEKFPFEMEIFDLITVRRSRNQKGNRRLRRFEFIRAICEIRGCIPFPRALSGGEQRANFRILLPWHLR